jgi:hypothetical protein
MMPVLEILFHVLELAATFAVGAWTGRQRCRVALAISSDEVRKDSWLDRLCCALPRKAVSWRRGLSEPKSEP